MGELSLLCFRQRHVLARPISTAVLHVFGIEHEPVKVVADVVVMRDVLLGPSGLVEGTDKVSQTVANPAASRRAGQAAAIFPAVVGTHQRDQLHHVAWSYLAPT